MYHEQLVKHNNLNTKMNLHNDDDNVNDGDTHDIIIMLAYILSVQAHGQCWIRSVENVYGKPIYSHVHFNYCE